MGGAEAGRQPHPWIFLALVTPVGITTGYVTVTLAFVLGAKGVTAAAVGALVAANTLPQTWEVLWAALLDTTLSHKLWYLLGALGTGLSFLAISVIPQPAAAMPLLTALVVASSL